MDVVQQPARADAKALRVHFASAAHCGSEAEGRSRSDDDLMI
jgi:hypothetical protein